MEKIVKKMDFTDVAMIKAAAFLFGMFAMAYLPQLAQYMWHFLGLSLLMAVRPFYRGYLK